MVQGAVYDAYGYTTPSQQRKYILNYLVPWDLGGALAEVGVPVGIPSELARRRPDIRAAEAQLHAATADANARRDHRPYEGRRSAARLSEISWTRQASVTAVTSTARWRRRAGAIPP